MWEQIAIGEFLNWRILFGDLVEVSSVHAAWFAGILPPMAAE